ncbi:helix-turn-helix domain-containing protein [Nocardia sp. JW2]|uniref:helix-turn-helix domain-containing protein n=1 Tax=Nocardia sp. JW2 TaxID=3450738 RepID=UPI003F6E1F42
MDSHSAIVGAQLRAAREAAGVSLAGLASRIHRGKSALAYYETGERTPPPDVIGERSCRSERLLQCGVQRMVPNTTHRDRLGGVIANAIEDLRESRLETAVRLGVNEADVPLLVAVDEGVTPSTDFSTSVNRWARCQE